MNKASLFFREWWVGKSDLPTLEMFKMLKVEQSRELIPLPLDENDIQISIEEANKDYIYLHFQKAFEGVGEPSNYQQACISTMGEAKSPIAPSNICANLEQNLTNNEIIMAISSLKDK